MVLNIPAPKGFQVSEDPSSVAQLWKKWCSVFEYYILATGVTNDEQKRTLLLHVAGQEVQDVFATLTPADATFTSAKEVLNKYFAPKTNVRYERFLFRQCSQLAHESVDSFVTRLHKLASTCEFQNAHNVIIDQISEKCNSHELRKKLLQEKT